MRKFLVPIILFAVILYSCGGGNQSSNTTDSKDSNTVVVKDDKDKVNKPDDSPYSKELKLIDKEVSKINSQLSSLKKNTKQDEKLPCEISEWKNKNDLVIKYTKSCGDNSLSSVVWELYFIELDANSNKVLFGKYLKEEYNAPKTYTKEKAEAEGITDGYYDPSLTKKTVRTVYSIGTLIKGDEHFGLILDENGKKITKGIAEFDRMYEQVQIDMFNN